MKSLLLAVGFVLLSFCSWAYAYMSVNDPRNGGLWSQGVITAATVTVTPDGDYVFYELEMSVNSSELNSEKFYDSLEFVCNFDMPTGAIVKSASLLIDNEWINAELLPRKEATAIYEGLVKRRIDPLIMYKNSGDNYQFKIFPLNPTNGRTMKMTYMVPAQVSGEVKSLALPTELFKASATPVNYSVLLKKSSSFENPQFAGGDVEFTQSENPDYLTAKITSDTDTKIVSSTLATVSSFKASKADDAIAYRLSLNLKDEFALVDAKKILFIIDNDPTVKEDSTYEWIYTTDENGTTYSNRIYKPIQVIPMKNEELYKEVLHMLSSLSSENMFNVILKNNGVYKYSSDWKNVTPENLSALYQNLVGNDDSYTSDLKTLLTESTPLVNEEGVFSYLLTNSKENYGVNYNIADSVARDLKKASGFNNAVVLLTTSYIETGYINTYYYSNYFLRSLSNLLNKNGNYYYYYGSVIYSKEDLLNRFSSYISNNASKLILLNINTYTNEGTVYDKVVTMPQLLKPENNYIELGRVSAGTKFFADVSFRYKGQLYMKKIEFTINQETDSLMEYALTSAIIDQLNSQYYSKESIALAEKMSLEYGLLTKNTSFLALEPGIEITYCEDCPDWQGGLIFLNDVRIGGLDLMTTNGLKLTTTSETATTEGGVVETNTGTGTEIVNTGVDYFDLGFDLGIKEGEATCSDSQETAYQQGYETAKQEFLTSLNEQFSNALAVYPNPFTSELIITLDYDKAVTVEIYDVLGNLIESHLVLKSITLNAENSKIASLTPGIYTIKVDLDGTFVSKSAIKNKFHSFR
ncbi:MAG: T9SS type A sorting domain-containing protein [Bacteroidales bacterium]|nr:T9SS type A sorting domain-containing protein [Bacteroidales bacterium]